MPHNRPLDTAQELAHLRQQIEELHLVTPSFAAVGITNNHYIVAVIDEEKTITLKGKSTANNEQAALDWLRKHAREQQTKIVAAAVLGGPTSHEFGARLWLEEDIVPHIINTEDITEATVQQAADNITFLYDPHTIPNLEVDEQTQRVEPAFLVTAKDYENVTPAGIWNNFQALSQEFQDQANSLLFINSTPRGGGVALMRHALIRLVRLLNLDVHWHIMQPSSAVFDITKTKFHNILQEVAPDGMELTKHDEDVYNSWISENFERLEPAIAKAKVIVIDDPQPSGLISHIREKFPAKPIMYRSHIHLDRNILEDKSNPAYKTWNFIWNNAGQADVFLHHPIEVFVPRAAEPMALAMPATTDPVDGLNKPLSEEQLDFYMKWFNKILLEHSQKPLDLDRPYLVQIARFDPSKGITDVIEAYHLLRQQLGDKQAPQLVLAGHGSIDDPDGVPLYNLTLQTLQEDRYKYFADDVKVARLPHSDQILDAVLRRSKVVLQLSLKEGFEIKVTEALHKGKPVVAYRTGGIPLQIEDGVTGYLVERGQCQEVANKLHELLTNDDHYSAMSKAAIDKLNHKLFTVQNLNCWLYLANALERGETLPGQGHPVADLIDSHLE